MQFIFIITLITVFHFIQWVASSQWSSFPYFPMRDSDEITIEEVHPTLVCCLGQRRSHYAKIRNLKLSSPRDIQSLYCQLPRTGTKYWQTDFGIASWETCCKNWLFSESQVYQLKTNLNTDLSSIEILTLRPIECPRNNWF